MAEHYNLCRNRFDLIDDDESKFIEKSCKGYIHHKHPQSVLSILFKMNNCKIFNVQVDDRLRYSGVSKYSFNNRFWVGIIDLIKVYFLTKKGETNGD